MVSLRHGMLHTIQKAKRVATLKIWKDDSLGRSMPDYMMLASGFDWPDHSRLTGRRAYREDHGVAEHLYEVLMQKPHVARAEEAQILGSVLLHSYQLLRITFRALMRNTNIN